MKAKREIYEERLSSIRQKLHPESHLLIVSKTRPIEDIELYYELGQRDFGENRVQELQEKSEALKTRCPDIRWHMIGHLQSNKITHLFDVCHLYAIHSVDDRELLDKLIKSQHRLNNYVEIFLQYNASKEQEKSGFESYEELLEAAKILSAQEKLKLLGLMTMGTLRTERFEDEARRCFQELNDLKNRLQHDLGTLLYTSMGMSQDYEIALAERSNWIRLGSTMFALRES